MFKYIIFYKAHHVQICVSIKCTMFKDYFLRYTALPNYSPSPVSEPYKESNTIRQSIYNPPPLINKRGGLIKYFLGTGGPFVKHLLVNITPNQYFPKIVKKHCEKQQKL